MKRLKELSNRVKTILEANESARNSDNVLYLHVLRSYGEEKGLDIDKMSVPMLTDTYYDRKYKENFIFNNPSRCSTRK